MMPEKERSSRTTCVKRVAWAVAVSARGAKSATAMRGSCAVLPRPVPVWNQSWARTGEERKKLKTIATDTIRAVFFADNGASGGDGADRNTLEQLESGVGENCAEISE